MTTQGHSLVPGTAGGLSKHQPSVCPASNLLLPEVCAEGTELAASSKPLLSSHASGPFRTQVPNLKFPSLTVCGAETSFPLDTDPCIFLPCFPGPAWAGFHRSQVISVLPATTHCPTRSAGKGGPPGEDSALLTTG